MSLDAIFTYIGIAALGAVLLAIGLAIAKRVSPTAAAEIAKVENEVSQAEPKALRAIASEALVAYDASVAAKVASASASSAEAAQALAEQKAFRASLTA